MSLFGGRTDQPGERTAQERERARLEREARRGLTGELSAPVEAEPHDEEDAAVDPQATEAHDVLVEEDHEEPDDPAPVAAPPPPAAVTRLRREGRVAPALARRMPALPPRGPRNNGAAADEADGSREPRRARSWPRRIGAGLALLLILLAGWFLVSLYQPFKGDGGDPVRVKVPSGLTAREIGDLLADRGVVSSGFFFALRARLDGKREQLKAGTYRFRKDMKFTGAEAILVKGPPPIRTVKLVLPEGNTERDFAAAVDKSGKVRGEYTTAVRRARFNPGRYGAPAGSPLEGFLFPATYELRKGRQATAQALVNQQLAAFKRNLRGVSMRKARAAKLSTYDVLIIASMIEREASVAKDRPLVASVIYNRLKQSIPLGIDATIRYATNNWTRPIRQSELQAPGPYNTRLNQGLPPTPIGNPGLASIRAAANPARTGYLYFVVKPGGKGEHAFSTTYNQFLRDQARYNQARNARGGRDPSTP